MSKREAFLKSEFTKELHRQLPQFLLLEFATVGAPDRAIVGNGETSFFEFKHGMPSFESPGNQELLCMRLAVQGFCRYVVWQESARGEDQRTLIVEPKQIHHRNGWQLVAETFTLGYDQRWLVAYIRQVHRV